jgi:hypothetical protein
MTPAGIVLACSACKTAVASRSHYLAPSSAAGSAKTAPDSWACSFATTQQTSVCQHRRDQRGNSHVTTTRPLPDADSGQPAIP